MNRAFHSVALAAALFLFTTFTSAATHQASAGTMTTQRFEFVSNRNRLSGFVDVPAGGAARAMIVIIHGYGKTDIAGRTSYYDLRSRFTQLGISTLIWDKPGCGESKGAFDADQPVQSSAKEVLDAIRHARESKLPGVTKSRTLGYQPRRMDRATGDHARSQNRVLDFGEWHGRQGKLPLPPGIQSTRRGSIGSGNQTLAW